MRPEARARARQVAAVVALLFGIASLGAGGSVLAGRDPGYLVNRPLVLFNTVMGLLYIGVGILAWRRSRVARVAAAGIVLMNLPMLAFTVSNFRVGIAAIDSVRAMLFRTGVWLVIWLVLWWAAEDR